MSAEPREFWIEPEHNGRVFIPYNESKTLVEYSGAPPKSCLLVIEHSAYQALEQKLAVATQALSEIAEDFGTDHADGNTMIAHEALALINADAQKSETT